MKTLCTLLFIFSLSVFSLSAQTPPDTLTLHFKPGWNIFSTNVMPDSADLKFIFQPLIDNGKLLKIQDENGNALEDYGILGGWTNNAGDIALTKGYKIKVADTCHLLISGEQALFPLDIPLKIGWNIMGYPRNFESDGMAEVQPLIYRKTLVKVQDETGNSIEDYGIFGGWTNNIGNFKPGEGYKIKVAGNEILTLESPNANWQPGDPWADSRDRNDYNTVQIGSQVWMAENLAWLPAVNPPSERSLTDPLYYVYDYNGTDVTAAKTTANYHTYGVLYNWLAALTACPAGWHLPGDAEWTILENYLIANGYNYDGTTTGNKIAKSMAAKTNWNPDSNPGAPGNDPLNNNSSGFAALPGGLRDLDSMFKKIGRDGYWWSSTEINTLSIWHRSMYYYYSGVYRVSYSKLFGQSVRCLKDQL